ncbi:MAG: Succinate dehydrogenase flavoprotein subunit, partial [Dehalococcoidia bacterium]|nr:Succinate dehydrogenase flavoprotein subunit [Dehalococcoidia bacterium]
VIHPFFPDEDDYDAVFKEAVEKSNYLCDQERLEDHLSDFVHRVREMDGFGVKFEKGSDGKLERQAGRGTTPVMMFHGGFQMMGVMRQAAVVAGVEVVDRVMITDLLTRDDRVVGAVGFNTTTGAFHVFQARATVMATGRTWLKGRRPGQRNLSGDGIAAAYRAGAVLTGFDLGSPNQGPALYDIGPGNNMHMGSGAILANARGESFIERYDPVLKGRTELSVLATACAIEARQGRTPLHLDMTHISPDKVQRMKRVLPLPMMMYERAGVVQGDRFVKRIEWVTEGPSCAGGLKVNRCYETSLSGLFACGDAMSRAGPSGQNALAGAATSGARAGKHAAEYAREAREPKVESGQIQAFRDYVFQPLQRRDGIEPDTVLLSLQETLMPYDVLLLRHQSRMIQALRRVEELWNEQVPRLCAYDFHYLRMALETRNMVLTAMFLLKSALAREESREMLREDYPDRDNKDWVRWVTLKKEGEEAKVGTEAVALERCRIKPEPERSLHPLWEVVKRQGQIRIENGQVAWV